MEWRVEHMRAEELLASLPDNSVDLILTDPPYYKVKSADWDRQWASPAAFLDWMGGILEGFRRVMKPNGSLYVFASPQMAAEVEVLTKRYFNVLNSITWRKMAKSYAEKYGPENFRQFVGMSERIIFAEHYGNDETQKGHCFGPVVDYLRSERDASGLGNDQIDNLCGWRAKAFHFFAKSGSNFCLPTAENYEGLRQIAPGHFSRPYEDLRREYEDLRRPFFVTADAPYTDVWDFPTVAHYSGKHECEKPQELLRHIIKASSREGTVVLDTFCGGGSTGEAAVSLGRSFIGCDMSEHWSEYTRKRLERVASLPAIEQARLF